ncbi:hypothetical protein K0I63_06065 [Shewanella rhizosphaerae]|uniref:hypothetical protein n=1 Tax=Shewanella rhizosphaerae TaxID=2864207 RepID=UPI001C6600F7|nr:hypothetical protein [Shewanella rhizosphaerae]QYK14079.1 hypothetical protein K0I63_06065 [Shewanella rhizosphaerae]
MRHFFRALKWILFTLLFIPVGGYLILLLINLQDSAPSAQASAFLEQVNAEEAALSQHLENNPYLYAMGFDAPEDDDPMAVGLERYQVLRQLEAMQRPSQTAHEKFKRPEWAIPTCLKQEGYLDECAALFAEPEPLKATLDDYAWLIERYRTLLSLGQWQDDTRFNMYSDLLPMQHLIAAQQLFLVDAYINGTDSASLITAIDKDMQFWQQAAMRINMLGNKFLAISALKQHMKLGELLVSQMRTEGEDTSLPSLWLAPIPGDVLALDRAKRGEWHFLTKMTQTFEADEKADFTTKVIETLLMPLLKQQDTANRYADILTGKASIKQCPNDLSLSTLQEYAYNPMGKFILCSGISSFESYQATANKVESLRAELVTRLTTPAISAGMVTEVNEEKPRESSPE